MSQNKNSKKTLASEKGLNTWPRRLPTITLKNGKTYFVDKRLCELRNVDDPNDWLDFRDILQSRADLLRWE